MKALRDGTWNGTRMNPLVFPLLPLITRKGDFWRIFKETTSVSEIWIPVMQNRSVTQSSGTKNVLGRVRKLYGKSKPQPRESWRTIIWKSEPMRLYEGEELSIGTVSRLLTWRLGLINLGSFTMILTWMWKAIRTVTHHACLNVRTSSYLMSVV